jgi:phage gp37-like protein
MAQIFNQGYAKAILITKSDTVNFDASVSTVGQDVKPCDAIWVGGAGIVKAVMQDGSTAEFTCVAGTLLPIRAIRVFSATTTATLMYALYASP